jgi:hypothetical protein
LEPKAVKEIPQTGGDDDFELELKARFFSSVFRLFTATGLLCLVNDGS